MNYLVNKITKLLFFGYVIIIKPSTQIVAKYQPSIQDDLMQLQINGKSDYNIVEQQILNYDLKLSTQLNYH